ncbi:unnamed protein product, partial [Staurois parvus]
CGDRRCAVSLGHSGSQINRKSRRCRLSHVTSCVQSHGTDDQCALMISVGPRSANCQCPSVQLSVFINATCQCPSVPHQCHISVPTSAHQCHISVPI